MQFLNDEINKICGVNIIKKIIEKKQKYNLNGQKINNFCVENSDEPSNKLIYDVCFSDSICSYKYDSGKTVEKDIYSYFRTNLNKTIELSSCGFFTKHICIEDDPAIMYIWRTIGMNLEENCLGVLAEIIIKEGEKRNNLRNLIYLKRHLQIERKCQQILQIILGSLYNEYKLNKNSKNCNFFDYLDHIIVECPSINYLEKVLLNANTGPCFFKGLTKSINYRIISMLNSDEEDLGKFAYKIANVGIISDRLYQLWLIENNELQNPINTLEILHLNRENSSDLSIKTLINLIIVHGYLLRNKFENNHLNEKDIYILINKLREIIRGNINTELLNSFHFLIEMIMLQLSGENSYSDNLKTNILMFTNEIIGNYSSGIIIALVISNIIKNFEICRAPKNENKLHEELISIVEVFFPHVKQNYINTDVMSEVETLKSKLDIEILELLLKNGLIEPKMVKNTVKLILNRVHDNIFRNIKSEMNGFENNKINFNLLTEIIENKYNDHLSINELLHEIIQHFTGTIKIFYESINSNMVDSLFNFKIEQNKAFTIRLISKVNSIFDEIHESLNDQQNFIKIINCYEFPKIIQSILKDNISKSSCCWTLTNEGIQFLNNYILMGIDCDLLNNSEELVEFSKFIMNEIKKRFINEQINKIEIKTSIPPSNIYFELLRLIHNSYNISIYRKTPSPELSTIRLLNRGLVPFNLNIGEENPDFLIDTISSYFRNTSQRNKSMCLEKDQSTNIIFIHGFLGSAFKSWNIDISKDSRTPIVVDDNFQSINIPFIEEDTIDTISSLKVHSNSISKLEKSNYLIWPRILLNENKHVNMFAVDYSHSIFNQGKSTTLEDISEEIYTKLLKANILPNATNNYQEKNNIVLCHSMGGVLLKLIVSNHPETLKSFKGIIFFGTPHFGTNLHSKFVRLLKKKVSSYIIELSSYFNINDLRELNSKFQKLIYSLPKQDRPLIYSFSEDLPCKIPFMFNIGRIIVPHFNSNPCIGNFYILKTDHNFINKLTIYKNDIRYVLIKYLINL
ncbi:putative HSMGG motif [Cryptosporidium canis]|nr:putative HSMGG motif [Cryptosporidium canis]